MKKFFKILSYVFGSILLLVILLLAFTQTGWFKDIAKGYAEDLANDKLNGTLTIGEISGSIFGNLQISDIRIEQNDSTFFYCKLVALDYDLSGILFNEIDINFIFIDSIYTNLKQVDDSTWNAMTLVKPSDEVEETDTSSSSFDWKITLDKFELKRSEIEISTIDTSAIPNRISELNIAANALITPEIKKLVIEKFTFATESPDFKLRNILLSAEMTPEQITVNEFNILSGENKIFISGNYYFDDRNISAVNLKTDPINFSEFKSFAPSLELNGSPIITIDGSYQNSLAQIEASITEEEQKVLISGQLESIKTMPVFLMSIIMENINAGYWINDTAMATDINSAITINGKGKTAEDLNINSELLIYDSQLLRRYLDSLKLNTKFSKGNLNGDLSLASGFGSIDGVFNIAGISDRQKYKLDLTVNEFNTAPVLLNDSLSSNINFALTAEGEKFDPDSLSAEINFVLGSSNFKEYSLDSLFTNIGIQNGVYSIDTFHFENKAAVLSSSGNVNLKNDIDLTFRLDTKDLNSLPQLRDMENFNIDGYIMGTASGSIDSLNAFVEYKFDNFTLQTNSADQITGSVNFLRVGEAMSADVKSRIDGILASEITVDNVTLDAEYKNDLVDSKIVVAVNDSLSATIASSIKLDSVISIALKELNLSLDDYVWENQNDSTLILIGNNRYTVDNFYLSNGDQFLKVDGFIDTEKRSDLKLQIKDLDAGEFIRAVKPDESVSAIINTDLKVSGSITNPIAEGKIDISNILYKEFEIGDITTDFELAEEKLNWNFELERKGENINSSGFIPISFQPEEDQSVIPGNEPLEINLKIDSLDLSSLPKFGNTLDQLKGKIRSDLSLYNTLNNLQAKGYFSIDDSEIKSSNYGITFDEFNLRIEADSDKIYIKKINLVNGDGSLEVEGFAGYPGGLLNNKLDPLEISLKASEFEIAKTRNYEAKIDGELNFNNNAGEASISGNITVLRSRFYLPYFTDAASEKQFNTTKPILIREIDEMKSVNDSAETADGMQMPDTLIAPPFIKKLNGRFTLSIPKNTWLIAPQFNLELSGDIDVVKESKYLELFGNVNVVRGKIEIYGKEFKVLEGRIILNGGRKLNPELVMSLEYMFRDADRTKKYLQLSVSGTAESPELEFSLEGNTIDEGNAISYILFGRSLDELTQSQKSGVNSSKQDIARSLAASFVASQLSSTLGETFGLDVIEIEGGENWRQATITAGKYLSDDLYVSYERGIGTVEPNEVKPKIVTLEYELTPFLFLQLVEGNDKTTGFDAIFKFNW